MTIKKYTIHVHMLEYMYRLIEAIVDGKQFGGKLQLVYMRQMIDNLGLLELCQDEATCSEWRWPEDYTKPVEKMKLEIKVKCW